MHLSFIDSSYEIKFRLNPGLILHTHQFLHQITPAFIHNDALWYYNRDNLWMNGDKYILRVLMVLTVFMCNDKLVILIYITLNLSLFLRILPKQQNCFVKKQHL